MANDKHSEAFDIDLQERIIIENERALQHAISCTRRTAEQLVAATGGSVEYDTNGLHALVTPPGSESLFTFEGDLGTGLAFVVYQTIVTVKRLPSVGVSQAIEIYNITQGR